MYWYQEDVGMSMKTSKVDHELNDTLLSNKLDFYNLEFASSPSVDSTIPLIIWNHEKF